MAATPLLNITQVSSSQNNKEVTINDGFLAVERSMNDALAGLDFTAGDITMGAADYTRYFVFVCATAPVPANLIVPKTKRVFGIKNDTASTITVKTDAVGGVSSAIESGTRAVLFCDGTNVHYFASGEQPGSALFYDLGFQFPGLPGSDEAQEFVAVRAFKLPVDGGTSIAKARAAATASTTLNIYKNDTQIGTIVFGAAQTDGVINAAAETAFAAGDILRITNPLIPDETLADIAITLACNR